MAQVGDNIEELFWQASCLPRDQREQLIAQRCGGDQNLRNELESLLAHHDASERFMANPAAALADGELLSSIDAPALDGAGLKQVGRYRILDVLGQGGMGIVYRAEQDSPRRVVALKVIRPGVALSSTLRRFTREAQVLGRLQHPGIAQIYEAGTFDVGGGAQPYFAMELVVGRPITDFANDHRLTTSQRLELMAKVCIAVEHAHQQGVIHRDLKPVNILVVDADSQSPGMAMPGLSVAQPKILDFGVARIVDPDAQLTTIQTDVGQLIGTIPYMSPEQIGGEANAIDRRSDVYALGVVCYELLTGRRPHDLANRAIAEAARIVREEEPAPLSSIDRNLRGDIETIVGKALEKDPSRRYGTAAELAADLTRYLRDEPIVARPPSAMYQFRKYAQRNKAVVTGVAVAFATLIIAVVLISWQAIIATQQRIRAEDAESLAKQRLSDVEQAKAEEETQRRLADERREEAERNARIAQVVNQFLTRDILAAADPRATPNPNITLREAIDKAATNVGDRFKDDPLVEAGIRRVLGDVYHSLGEPLEALPHLERARALYLKQVSAGEPLMVNGVLAPNRRSLLGATNDLAILYTKLGRTEAAETLYLEGLEIRKEALGPEHRDTLAAMINLATGYRGQGRLADAERLLKQCIEIIERRLQEPVAEGNIDTTGSRGTLSFQASYNNRPPTQEELFIAKHHLANVFLDAQRYAEVEPLIREVMEYHRQSKGDNHPYTVSAMNSLGMAYKGLGRAEDAVGIYERVLEVCRGRLGPEHPDTAAAMANLADGERQLGRFDRAIELLNGALVIVRKSLGETHPTVWHFTSMLGSVYNHQQRCDLAEPLYAQAVAGAKQHLPSGHWSTGVYLLNQGKCLIDLRRWGEAEPLLLEAQQILISALGQRHAHAIATSKALAHLYSETQRPELAAEQEALRRGPQFR